MVVFLSADACAVIKYLTYEAHAKELARGFVRSGKAFDDRTAGHTPSG